MSGARSFLDDLAEKLLVDFSGNLEGVSIVFPNRRAGLFFTRALAGRISNPIWSPAILSFEDFIYSLTDKTPSDNLSLLLDLYDVFVKKSGFKESFDRFYYWGDMLLKDFNEIDKNLIRVEALFTTLKNLKEIDAQFAFMSQEERDAIRRFWGSALEKKSIHKDSFLQFWSTLYPVYISYKEVLKKSGMAYSGMIYRDLCTDIKKGQFKWTKGNVIFAGFNAFSPSEELIVKWFIESSHGSIFWDIDAYYFNNKDHEAGSFFRQYYNDQIFRKSFPSKIPDFFKEKDKHIHTIASSQYSGQAKIAGNLVRNIIAEQGVNSLDNTVVVFPDESLLPQVLYSLPDNLDKINITMGYQLNNSAFFSLFDNLLDLQETIRMGKNKSWFYHKHVINILNHHFVSGIAGEICTSLIGMIEKNNMTLISSDLFNEEALISEIFNPLAGQNLFDYLIQILIKIRGSFDTIDEEKYFFEKEFSIVFYKLLNRLKEIFAEKNITITPEILKRILKYYAQLEKIPFSGEPLEGLQMMGLMETRNLDFKNVIILCVNEGQLPNTGSMNSFIPYNVRKAFGLPNTDSQDSIYSYLFYRLIQRSKNVYLVYNTEESSVRQSEPSRYIYQLKFESGFDIQPHWLSLDIAVTNRSPIVISKDNFVMKRLQRYCLKDKFKFSPSSLNVYLSCPLNFYYRYVLDIVEEMEVSEDLDPAKFGNILHNTMDHLYRPYIGKMIVPEYIENIKKHIDDSIRKSFSKYYGQKNELDFQFEGKNILGREIIKNYINKILEKDKNQGPFEIVGLEKRYSYDFPMKINGVPVQVGLKGIIDRIDTKDGITRIIDYKSGRDESSFKDIPGLFDNTDDKRNKAIFQAFFYALLFIKNNPEMAGGPIISGLYNFRELYNKDFDIRIKLKRRGFDGFVDNILVYMDEYEEHLTNLISEIFDSNVPFKHRDDKDSCMYCEGLGMPSDMDG